jgi:hypothetical protein
MIKERKGSWGAPTPTPFFYQFGGRSRSRFGGLKLIHFGIPL